MQYPRASVRESALHGSCCEFVEGSRPSCFECFVFEAVDLFGVFTSLSGRPRSTQFFEVDARHGAVSSSFGVLFVEEILNVFKREAVW